MAVVEGGKPSTTDYTVRERFTDTSLLDCHLITGRTHQIRVHLAALGHPIIGDPGYGQRSHLIDRQALHARLLAFDHPSGGRRLRIEVEPPTTSRSSSPPCAKPPRARRRHRRYGGAGARIPPLETVPPSR